jgi:hypothetical protein
MAIDLSSISTSDLEALAAGNLDSVSTPALRLLSGEGFGTGETLARGFERGITSTLRGLSQFFGNDLDFYNRAFGYQTDQEKEQEFRAMMDSNTGAAITGVLAGSIADPTNLIPIGTAKNIKQFIGQGSAVGAVAGVLEPTYEDEFGDSRVKNTLIGAGFGAAIGGAIGKLVSKGEAARTAAVESSGAPMRTADDIAQEAVDIAPEPIITPEQFTTLLDIQRRIEVGDLVTPGEQRFLRDFEDQLPPLSPDAVRAFDIQSKINDGKLITPADQRFLSDFNKLNKPIFEVPTSPAKFVDEAEATVNPLNKAATESGSEVSLGKAMAESEQVAFKTGDYRDYLKTSAVRFADIKPEQFARMVDPANPFKNANVKVLVSKTEQDQEALQQVYGALLGRFRYERQTGKTFEETTREGVQNIPENVAVEALLNKKVQEILPPEVLASAVSATRNAINDLSNARELARVARERGSEEGYAVLQSMMTRAAGLLGAVEGNASNLGRALNYQKQLNRLIAENKQLTPFLGGRSC